jgi:homoserine kinase
VNASELVGRRVTVEAPATIANLGAGYDCLGLAVDLTLHVTIEARAGDPGTSGVELRVDGEGVGELPHDRSNRLVVALEAGLEALGIDGAGAVRWTISMSNPIPLERGLGSSAAATVAGIVAAGALAGQPLDMAAALRVVTGIEGHPDNVAPALLGGLTASIALDDRVESIRLDPPDVGVVAWIPDRRLATSDMRQVLPASVPRADAVANLARVAVGVAGLASGRTDVLAVLTEDRLHEPYRAAAYPELPALIAAARGAGAIGACLAGSGSTVVAFVDPGDGGATDRVADAFATEAARLGLPGRAAVLRSHAALVWSRLLEVHRLVVVGLAVAVLILAGCANAAWPKAAAETTCADWSNQMTAAQRDALGTAILLALRASDGGNVPPRDGVIKAYVTAISDTCKENSDARISTVGATLYNLSKDLQP